MTPAINLAKKKKFLTLFTSMNMTREQTAMG